MSRRRTFFRKQERGVLFCDNENGVLGKEIGKNADLALGVQKVRGQDLVTLDPAKGLEIFDGEKTQVRRAVPFIRE